MIKKLYRYIINVLSKHKLPALLLSHGGLHLIVLLICIVAAIFMYGEIDRYNQRVLRQFTFRIDSDTMENYKLSHLELYVFRDTVDTLKDDIRYMFQLGYKDSSNYKTEVSNTDPYKGYKIDAVHKVTIVSEDTIIKNWETKGQIYIKDLGKYSPDNTAKFGKDVPLSEKKTTSYWWFTQDDEIKKDNLEFSLKNLTNNWQGDNPYFCCYYGFHAIRNTYNLDENSTIAILYNPFSHDNHSKNMNSHNDMYVRAPMTVDDVYPKPTYMDLNVLIYKGRDVENVLDQGGVYLSAVDPEKKNHADRMEMLWTVLLGTIIAFSLDIIVQLIIKWRKL